MVWAIENVLTVVAVAIYQIWLKYTSYFLVRAGGLCLCSCGFNRRMYSNRQGG
ncbi:hypothetical protein [Phormidium nigroviride]